MSFGNVGTVGTIRVATPAEREAFLREGREAIESNKKIQELRQEQARIIKQIAQNIGEEADRGKEVSLKKIATYQQEIAASQQKKAISQQKIAAANAERDHGYMLNAVTKAVLNRFTPTEQEIAQATTPELNRALEQKCVNAAKARVEKILARHEAKGVISVFSEKSRCMTLTQGAVDLLLDTLTEVKWNAADLTRFKGEIELKALNVFLASGLVTEVTLAQEAEEVAKQAKFGKNVKVYLLKDNRPVELQGLSTPLPIVSNKKEASPNSSPEGSPKRVHSSPEGSPPKYSVAAPISRPLPDVKVNSAIQPQVAKPLPAVPPKPLPKPPARKQAALEAK